MVTPSLSKLHPLSLIDWLHWRCQNQSEQHFTEKKSDMEKMHVLNVFGVSNTPLFQAFLKVPRVRCQAHVICLVSGLLVSTLIFSLYYSCF